MSDLLTPTKVDPLETSLAAALDREGHLLLRGAVPEDWRERLTAAFDAGVGPPEQWAAPRAPGWRHALVDLDPIVQATCRLPVLLSAAERLAGGCFFLAQVEGREPLGGYGHQPLHRDGVGTGAVAAMIYLDDYGPENGATRLIPRHLDPGEPDESLAQVVEGQAGDVLVFDADMLHGATVNRSGARRRSLLLSYMPAHNRAMEASCRAVRNVRMDTSELFSL